MFHLCMQEEVGTIITSLNLARKCKTQTDYLIIIKEIRYKLLRILTDLSKKGKDDDDPGTLSDVEREIFLKTYEIDSKENELNNLREEWEQRQFSLGKLQKINFRKSQELDADKAFSNGQGKAICTIFNFLTNNEKIIESLLNDKGELLTNFLNVAENHLEELKTRNSFEVADSLEYSYICCLYEGVRNISEFSIGTNFLLNSKSIEKIIKYLQLPDNHIMGQLKLIFLEILNNIANIDIGIKFLLNCEYFFLGIKSCLVDSDEVILETTLTILDKITKTNADERITNQFEQLLKSSSYVNNRPIRDLCSKISQNIHDSVIKSNEFDSGISTLHQPETLGTLSASKLPPLNYEKLEHFKTDLGLKKTGTVSSSSLSSNQSRSLRHSRTRRKRNKKFKIKENIQESSVNREIEGLERKYNNVLDLMKNNYCYSTDEEVNELSLTRKKVSKKFSKARHHLIKKSI